MDFAFFATDWLGKPAWMWLAFIGIVAALLVFDLGVLHKEHRPIEVKESLVLSGCGHWTQQERPDEVNAAMLRFLETAR